MSERAVGSIETSRFFSFLQKHSDFATLCAIRTFPSFPHTVINYGAAVLQVPLPRFVMSTAVGFAIKGYLYASVLRRAAKANGISEAFDLKTVSILGVVAVLFIAGKAIQHYGSSGGQK